MGWHLREEHLVEWGMMGDVGHNGGGGIGLGGGRGVGQSVSAGRGWAGRMSCTGFLSL